MQGVKVTIDLKTGKVIRTEEVEIDKEPDKAIDHMLTQKAVDHFMNLKKEKLEEFKRKKFRL
ncbi:hypothetical protein SAMN02745751_03177 [Dethiosulfatibacter aminovorans DSM 17477]|uniref:Uncharacterized protein n=1 Tax=Dethiosulfatibacter aminovorans DSM 17477 TaxID=1121476 RepID=A0A1M6LHF9_9FIRM|nr:hypothetical protein [Dethiosulfatibacter aminovorans]SHJ70652.1 hypothetical protein SAMN02745751_03177 [Dethiosulfatibacter aminovorans DSM 17477]